MPSRWTVILLGHRDAVVLVVGSCWIIFHLPALWIPFNLRAPIARKAGLGWTKRLVLDTALAAWGRRGSWRRARSLKEDIVGTGALQKAAGA
jgi:hypothetical protein